MRPAGRGEEGKAELARPRLLVGPERGQNSDGIERPIQTQGQSGGSERRPDRVAQAALSYAQSLGQLRLRHETQRHRVAVGE